MIVRESFSAAWINSHRTRPGMEKINPQLAEKMIHALALVEGLAGSGLDFVFKGGTSLILLMPTPGRFSIDIDIITQADRATIETVLDSICKAFPFTGFSLSEHRSYQPGIPKAHYALRYTSGLTGRDEHILLDILFDEHPYHALLEKPVLAEWVQTDERPILIRVPSHESITGDKLTAFAPNTTGIRYGKGKELEIIKQLYDLGRLFHEVKDITIVSASFDKTVAKEIVYRGNTCTREEVLQDIIDTGLLLARREKNKDEPHAANFKEMQRGLLQFKQYQMTAHFRIEEAILAAAKAALMAAAITTGVTGVLERFDPSYLKQDLLIQHPDYVHLNKLSAEALFYWHHTLKKLRLIE